jgi:hypothetical protein
MPEQAATIVQTQTLAAAVLAETESVARDSASAGSTITFSSAGPLPPVAEHAKKPKHQLTAADRAFVALHDGETPVVWRGGEPLPVLKELFWAPTTDQNLATFMRMVNEAPVRSGTHNIRTPMSPHDGLATIITGFVLRICNKYLPYCQQAHEPVRQQWLQQTIQNHLILLDSPSYNGYRSGGHLTRGLDGKLDALIGSTTPMDIAVNQTAIALWTLEQMRENPDPHYQQLFGQRVGHLLDLLFPEFQRELLRWYPPGRPPHSWWYSNTGQLEDPGHLKTTWSQLVKLGNSTSPNAGWYKAQADRIAKESPHVTAPDNQQSNIRGTVTP